MPKNAHAMRGLGVTEIFRGNTVRKHAESRHRSSNEADRVFRRLAPWRMLTCRTQNRRISGPGFPRFSTSLPIFL